MIRSDAYAREKQKEKVAVYIAPIHSFLLDSFWHRKAVTHRKRDAHINILQFQYGVPDVSNACPIRPTQKYLFEQNGLEEVSYYISVSSYCNFSLLFFFLPQFQMKNE